MQLRERLAEICKTHLLSDQGDATVPEPYSPFIPERWNGILVLAEAQNHGNAAYLDWLRNQCPDRIQRLYLYHSGAGVQPWDDGSLKLAVESALDAQANETAISNAVLWSQMVGRRNKNPEAPLIAPSVAVWKDMSGELEPGLKLLITAGNTARALADTAGVTTRRIHWRRPAAGAMSQISSMFSVDDLLSRYQEPGQTPEFDEYTVGLKGTLHVRLRDAEFDVQAGQAILVRKGEWVQYSTPGKDGAEYVAICLPAFSPETVHRDG